jgi:hypothetical protein
MVPFRALPSWYKSWGQGRGVDQLEGNRHRNHRNAPAFPLLNRRMWPLGGYVVDYSKVPAPRIGLLP